MNREQMFFLTCAIGCRSYEVLRIYCVLLNLFYLFSFLLRRKIDVTRTFPLPVAEIASEPSISPYFPTLKYDIDDLNSSCPHPRRLRMFRDSQLSQPR